MNIIWEQNMSKLKWEVCEMIQRRYLNTFHIESSSAILNCEVLELNNSNANKTK